MGLVLFLFGSPGVGKTSLARRLLWSGGRDPTLLYRPKWSFTDNVCAAGHYKGELFDGADTIPYNGAKDVLEWWSHQFRLWPLTLFDGDRMNTKGTLEFLERFGAKPTAILLKADRLTLTARRLDRGSCQDPSWIKGRETKSVRFAQQMTALELNTSYMTMDDVFCSTRDFLIEQGLNSEVLSGTKLKMERYSFPKLT